MQQRDNTSMNPWANIPNPWFIFSSFCPPSLAQTLLENRHSTIVTENWPLGMITIKI